MQRVSAQATPTVVLRCSILALLASGCSASPVEVASPLPGPIEAAGAIAIVFTAEARGVTVAIDGRLVVERARTDRVEITRVVPGIADVMIAAGSGPARVERHVRVDVEAGATTTIPVGAPDPGGLSGLSGAAFSLVAIIVSQVVTRLLF